MKDLLLGGTTAQELYQPLSAVAELANILWAPTKSCIFWIEDHFLLVVQRRIAQEQVPEIHRHCLGPLLIPHDDIVIETSVLGRIWVRHEELVSAE